MIKKRPTQVHRGRLLDSKLTNFCSISTYKPLNQEYRTSLQTPYREYKGVGAQEFKEYTIKFCSSALPISQKEHLGREFLDKMYFMKLKLMLRPLQARDIMSKKIPWCMLLLWQRRFLMSWNGTIMHKTKWMFEKNDLWEQFTPFTVSMKHEHLIILPSQFSPVKFVGSLKTYLGNSYLAPALEELTWTEILRNGSWRCLATCTTNLSHHSRLLNQGLEQLSQRCPQLFVQGLRLPLQQHVAHPRSLKMEYNML